MKYRYKMWLWFIGITTICYFVIASSKVISKDYFESVFSFITSFVFFTAFILLYQKRVKLYPGVIFTHMFNIGFILQIFGVSYLKLDEFDILSFTPWFAGVVVFCYSLFKLKDCKEI